VGAFADDTFITVEADTLDELKKRATREGEKVLQFFAANRMVANPSKTGLVVFRPSKTLHEGADTVQIDLDGVKIIEVNETTLLGVKISNDLNWKAHINYINSKINYTTSVLWRLRKVLGSGELRLLADGLFMSRIRYCLPVFGIESLRTNDNEPTSSTMSELQKAQNDVLRIITGRKRRDHIKIADMLKDTGFLSVNQTLAYACLMEMWKARSFNIPVLGDLFDRKRNDSRTLRSDTFDVVDSNCEETIVKKPLFLDFTQI